MNIRAAKVLGRPGAFLSLLCLMYFRSLPRIHHPEIWAEDGMIFLPDAIQQGAKSLLFSFQGYYDVFQRGFLLLGIHIFPALWLPVLILILYLVVYAWVFSAWVGEDYAWILPSRGARYITVLLCGLAPGLNEMVGSLCNLNWVFFFWLGLFALRDPKEDSKPWMGIPFVLILASIGTSMLLLPLYLWRLSYSFLQKQSKKLQVINASWVLLLLIALVSIFLARESEYAKVPTQSKIYLMELFIKTTFDHFFFRPWLGDHLAIAILRGVKLWRVYALGLGLLFSGLVLCFNRRKEASTQGMSFFTLGVLSWTVLSWIARPTNMYVFEEPLNEWLLRHRYSFALGVIGFLFWVSLLRPEFGKKFLSWRNCLFVLFLAINLWSAIPRFWIASYGKEHRWAQLSPLIDQKIKTGCPVFVEGPIYPDRWTLTLHHPVAKENPGCR